MSNSSTFYLKYRPQKINQLDLKDIRQKLTDIFSSGRVPHALLFSGPKGLGKTSAARIVAKAVNCIGKRKKGSFEPCNKCDICKSITAGTSLDLIEIDAASNRGIDDIRQLRDSIKLAPNLAEKKVYVIDEVHMLTIEAFNALLKTLEEPPDHALFVLCTTAAYKLPETIISRCQHFKFSLATPKEIVRSLKRIQKGERLNISSKALKKISLRAGGSFRDATKVLEMLVSLYGKTISLKQVNKFFAKEEPEANLLLALLADNKTDKALAWVEEAINKGADLKILTQTLLESLRQMLLYKFEVLEEKVDDYGLSVSQIKKLAFLFDEAGRQLRASVLPQLPLELAIVEWGEMEEEKEKDGAKDTGKKIKSVTIKKDRPTKTKGSANISSLLESWPLVLESVKQDNHSIEALLKATRPVSLKKDNLVVEVFYKFHKEKLSEGSCLQLVEKRLEEVFGKPLKLEFILSKKKK